MSVSILVVDDESDVADLIRQHFRREVRQGLYVLHFASSAKSKRAKQIPDRRQPALLLPLAGNRKPKQRPSAGPAVTRQRHRRDGAVTGFSALVFTSIALRLPNRGDIE
jgi:CheY-like chemotaxis protein